MGSTSGYAVKHGMGIIIYEGDLSELTLDWSENKIIKYEGKWENGAPNGSGTIEYKNGNTENGEFIDGRLIKN